MMCFNIISAKNYYKNIKILNINYRLVCGIFHITGNKNIFSNLLSHFNILLCTFQGDFNTWLNKSPLKVTYWYEPLKSGLINLTTHIFNESYWIKTPRKSIVKDRQPEFSKLKNCTAAITQQSLYVYPWFVIDCDAEYEATYACQETQLQDVYGDNTMANHTCEGDWFMVNGSDKCFLLLWPESALSFYDAQDVCSLQNASVYTVDVIARTYSTLLQDILSVDNPVYSSVQHILMSTSAEDLNNFVLGQLLAPDSPQNRLPSIARSLYRGEHETDGVIVSFANINGSCNVVRHSVMSYLFDKNQFQSMDTRSYRVYCRSCSEPLITTNVICEKESKPYVVSCQQKHFTCKDGTCIVDIYKCDSIDDCFDASDEDNCFLYVSNLKNQFIHLNPFLLGTGKIETTDVITIALHAICDGIDFKETILNEIDVCFQHMLLQIDLPSAKQNNIFDDSHRFSIEFESLFNLTQQEILLCYDSQVKLKTTIKERTLQVGSPVIFNATRKHNTRNWLSMDEICLLGLQADQRDSHVLDNSCTHLSCPGMFKCHKSNCIYMSSVCDGQYDCDVGDDELFCPLLSCPGLSKCRGENRCVSREQICDDQVNCLYSMDDEIGCYKCPTNCECHGYSLSCHVKNSLGQIWSTGINYIKGLSLKGEQRTLSIHNIMFYGLVYFNASFCAIEHVLFSNEKNPVNSFVIIASFSHNKLRDIAFLVAYIFQNLVDLDLSFNNLSIIRYTKSFVLRKLKILTLKGNPLKEININADYHDILLSLVDLQYIHHYQYLHVLFSAALHQQLHVKVTPLLMCCTLQQTIKCAYKHETKICTGLFQDETTQMFFYIMSLIALCLSLAVFLRASSKVSSQQPILKHKKKYYLIITLNKSIATLLVSLYLFVLFLADVLKVNVLFWTLGPICLCLKFILYISMETLMIIEMCSLLFKSLQIVYPFKHQCAFFKWTGPACLIIWLIVSISSAILFSLESGQQYYLCTFVNCSNYETFDTFLALICFTDILLIVSCIMAVTKVIMVLKRQNASIAKLQRNQAGSIIIGKVVFKLVAPFLSHFPIRICLLSLTILQLCNLIFEYYCCSVFIFILPVNLFLSTLLN